MCKLAVLGSQSVVIKCTATISFRVGDYNLSVHLINFNLFKSLLKETRDKKYLLQLYTSQQTEDQS